ncbi:MAG TPA: M14 family metallopeptidase [Gemmatimonadaceae bacterium]|nr:M14 family metallopeptidase [Gemmatimonadaceae bacterium]
MLASTFSSDYFAARDRFRRAAARLGWTLEAHAIDATGPRGEELTLDVASSASGDPERVLVVSSGIHGVEGFFGSAVQLALLEEWAATGPPPIACVFLHALNPYGFAWLRRVDEDNADPNRNFLLEGVRFEGANERYADLDAFLNPRRPSSLWAPFMFKALPLIVRYGVPALRQAIAEGQYDYPRGLFFGGAEPSQMQRLLSAYFPRWLKGSRHVAHLDFHTGLGTRGACTLLIDYAMNERQRARLTEWFGAGSFEIGNSRGIAYTAKGGLGPWCMSRRFAPDYLFAYAEFGTYPPIQMLAGLRAENQAHHWGKADSPETRRTKERLKELFCPADEGWRSQVLERSLGLVHRTLQELPRLPSDG